jgi:hypothetical protein
MRAELARRIAAHVPVPGEQSTAIPGLTLYRLTAPTACYAAEYETGMAVVAQGRKRVTLGRTTYLCDESTVFPTSVNRPGGMSKRGNSQRRSKNPLDVITQSRYHKVT